MIYQKKAYLTIDDSPSPNFLEKVNYLSDKKIPAIFFCIGQLMEKYPEEVIESIQRGFQIANHSYTHPHFSKIELRQCQYEIEKTDGIIEELYIKANIERTQKWFRFPYGDKGDEKNGEVFNDKKQPNKERKEFIQNVLQQLNYTQPSWNDVTYDYMKKAKLFDDLDWHWTFDIMEWATLEYHPTLGIRNLHKIFQRLERSSPKDARGDIGNEKRWLQSPSAEIILLHDHEETTPIFNSIIDKLLNLNLQFLRWTADD